MLAPKDFLLTKNGASLGFSFTSVAGSSYPLWQSDTLAAGGWTNTGLPAVTGDGTAKTMTLPAPVAGVRKRYYRLQLQ